MFPNPFLPNLAPSIAREILHTLRTDLPPPATDAAEALADRIETAMAMVASYLPTDVGEAQLAAQIVVADAHAKDCWRLALLPSQDFDKARRCRDQAAKMARLMQSGQRLLQRTQAMRRKLEAEMHPEAMERAGYWFRDASVPAPEPDQAPGNATAPEVAVPEPVAAAPAFETLTEAEQYAVIYPGRAALIRGNGGLPARLDFGPPEAEIVEALVHGTSPILRAIGPPPLGRPAAAA